MSKFPKGSQAAKDHMAHLRSLRGKGIGNSRIQPAPTHPTPAQRTNRVHPQPPPTYTDDHLFSHDPRYSTYLPETHNSRPAAIATTINTLPIAEPVSAYEARQIRREVGPVRRRRMRGYTSNPEIVPAYVQPQTNNGAIMPFGRGLPRFVKGSQEAKDHMALIRSHRKKK